jgi:hypothetical protein
LSEDPLGFGAGVNFYAYCSINPVNLNDPFGKFGEIVINGNNVTVTVPIRYTGSGKNSLNVGHYNYGIEKVWSGSFAGYEVTTKVDELSWFESSARTIESWFTGTNRQNTIEILHPNAMPSFVPTAAIGACSQGGGCQGWWPSVPPVEGASLAVIGAHEVGHILRLNDTNEIGTIMGPQVIHDYSLTVSNEQFNQVLSNYKAGWPTTNGGNINDSIGIDYPSWDGFSFNAGASGGYVLYLNKPNTNMMSRVYRK